MDNKTILITDISSGLGQALAEVALATGYRVVGTIRNEEARKQFDNEIPGRSLARILDVTDSEKVPSVLGPDALKFVTEKLHALETEMNEWKEVTLSTNFNETAVKS
jgi:NADP-dependent 3-hydroxy acid dehydrogenase YdfG